MKRISIAVSAAVLALVLPVSAASAGLFPRTWESAACTSRAVAELEIDVALSGTANELVVSDYRLVEVLYDPQGVLKYRVDFREEWKQGLEAQLRLYRRLAQGRPRYSAQFAGEDWQGSLRLVVFVTFVDSKAKVKLRWGDVALSGVNVCSHKSHHAWKRALKKLLTRRVRAEARGKRPGYCSSSKPEDSTMRRFSKPLESFPKARR